MKSYKCSKTEVHRVLANFLRNAPAKIQRKKQRIETEKKKTNMAKLEAVATMRKT